MTDLTHDEIDALIRRWQYAAPELTEACTQIRSASERHATKVSRLTEQLSDAHQRADRSECSSKACHRILGEISTLLGMADRETIVNATKRVCAQLAASEQARD